MALRTSPAHCQAPGRVCRSREGVQVGVDRAGSPEARPGGRPVGQCASQLQTGASANLVVTMLDQPSFHLTCKVCEVGPGAVWLWWFSVSFGARKLTELLCVQWITS